MKRSIKTSLVSIFLTAIISVSLLFFPGCTKLKHLADINVDLPYNSEVTIPDYQLDTTGLSMAGGVDISLPEVQVATNSKEFMAQYGTAAEKVVTVYLKSLSLQVLTPAGGNFNYIDKVSIYLSGKGLPEKLIATQNNVPKGSASLYLNTNTDINLKDYFIQEIIFFRLTAHVNALPPDGQRLNIASVFHVVANPLN